MRDKVFGELSYNRGWTKKENIKIWGKDNLVSIVVSAYEDEKPNDFQQNAYIRLKTNLDEISKDSLIKLKQYMNAIEKDILIYSNIPSIPNDVFKLISISEILFLENGSIGIMCFAKWDSHGIAILCKEDGIEVGPQDIVWLSE